MAAPRSTSLRALRQLSACSRQTVQVRKLHMTGPTTFPSPLLTSERPAVNLPKDLIGLQTECRKRNLPVTGSKQELADRLSADAMLQSRSFSSAIQDMKRPAASEADAYMAMPPVRHFNTSRTLKSVNDSSTIDFAYFPDFNPDVEAPPPSIRVPLLPQSVAAPNTAKFSEEAQESDVMRGTIVTASADSTHISTPSAMADVHDNNSIDIGEMAQKVAAAAQKVKEATVDETPVVRKVWNGFLDDLLGPKSSKATS
ncbi:hypothetical protein EJ05DRAFT_509360 [Pseudovirgaria hyperparasitica]|uniref:SAP domain-containing protein n=1 Tax=Pseudovirgaria hyperparasitica TaxID=470096 RepID=A0A6A6WEU2_9PEZI|nr:uncharacterized protein EJ05DRAFT_509360 [Pseudovirgaria hyperparasitica]KAF2759631.1 hypothetical protein EJ05DRAFT_509360 [Pseudovirgaria hyperparasitica]